MNLDESSKEEILKCIVSQKSIVSTAEIHKLLPHYEEEQIRELLNQDEFYEEICRRILYERENGAETNNMIFWSEEERT
jgi:uncharacterized membrane protein